MSTPSTPLPEHRSSRSPLWIFALIILALLLGWGVWARIDAKETLRKQSNALAETPVIVTHPVPSKPGDELVLPATVSAWTEAPLYARTSGYVKRWLVDIGQPVKAGQLLAEIESPEVDQQLRQAQADLMTAKANNDLAQSTALRWRAMLANDSVAKQDADEKIGDAAAKASALASAQANVQRLVQLQAFERIVAPFSGVITQRNVDVGALIDAGSTSPQALFHIADTRRLRIYVQVPQGNVTSVQPNTVAELHVADHPRQAFKAKVLATASAIDPSTRTLLTQLIIDNADAGLLAGSYGEVHFKLAARANSLRLPADTLLFRANGIEVAVVDAQRHLVVKPVSLGRDFGQEVEVIGGLDPSDQVVVNPPDSVATGDAVTISKVM